MALSKEVKDALAEHFNGKDVYDPSKDPDQEVSTFVPEGLSEGGMCYADGGEVPEIDLGDLGGLNLDEPFAGPVGSADTDTARGKIAALGAPAPDLTVRPSEFAPKAVPPMVPPMAKSPLQPPQAPQAVQRAPEAAPAAPQAPAVVPAPPAGSGKLAPNEWDQLLAELRPSKGQALGQAAFQGLAGLADAISTGVARSENPGFSKGIAGMQQQHKENLINALKAKYEAGFKGQELEQAKGRLAEESRHNIAAEKEATGRLSEEKRAHDLESGARSAQLQYEQGKETREAAQAQREADIKTVQDYGAFKTGGPSKQVYEQAMSRLAKQGASTVRIKDSNGGLHDLPVQSLAAAKKRDPGLQVIP